MQEDTLQDFLREIPDADKQETDIFKENLETPEKGATEEVAVHPNRKERRNSLQRQLDEEREARIRAETRAEVLSETKRFTEESGIDPRLMEIFSSDEVGKKGAATLAQLLSENQQKAKEEALNEFKAEQQRAVEEQRKYESVIDNELEAIEDKYDVDLTSDAPVARKSRREFLEMLQKFSPKDSEGNVNGYADFSSTFEAYQSQKEKADNSKQKEMASRSMQASGPVNVEKQQDDVQLNWLRRNGIRV